MKKTGVKLKFIRMKLIYLLVFEIKYQLKQKAFIGFSLLFTFLGYLIGSRGGVPVNMDYNSAYELSNKTGLLSLGTVFFIMFFTVNGVLREKQYTMESLLYSSPVTKQDYFISRFLGVYIPSLLIFTLCLVGLSLGYSSTVLNPERIQGFQLTKYLRIWLLFVVPNVFICTSLIVSVSILTKNTMATYVTAIGIYAGYFLCAIFLNSPLIANSVTPSPEAMVVAAIADPFGISAFFEQTQFWTPFHKNIQQVSFSGLFMWNRLCWSFIGVLVLLTTYVTFSFKQRSKKIKKELREKEQIISTIAYTTSMGNFTIVAALQSYFLQVKLEMKAVFKSLPFLAILLIWLIILSTEIYSRIDGGGTYKESLLPTTNILINIVYIPLELLSLLLLIFYSGELVWKERTDRINEIIYSTPTKNSVFFLSKFTVLTMLPLILAGVGILFIFTFQLTHQYYHFEIQQHLYLMVFLFFKILFFSCLCFFIQSITSNKYIGLSVTGFIVLLLGTPLINMVGIEHSLLKIGYIPRLTYSMMYGYSDTLKAFIYYAFCWVTLGVILSLLSFKVWQRGNEHTFAATIKRLRTHWQKTQRLAMVLFTVLFMVAVGLILYHTNIAVSYTNSEKVLNLKEAYERMYKKYDVPNQLIPVNLHTVIDLYPKERKYKVKVTSTLENKGELPLKEIFISEVLPTSAMNIENAKLTKHDTVHHVRLYTFEKALNKGEQIQYSYTISYTNKGFETSKSIVKNGTFIMMRTFNPIVGYVEGYEIQDPYERKLRNLPLKKEQKEQSTHFNVEDAHYQRIPIQTIISTQEDQIAIAPGNLVKSWKSGNRNEYQYEYTEKVIPYVAYFSGAYATVKENYKGIKLEHYYNPSHERIIADVTAVTKKTIDYCTRYFGEFPFPHVRMVEIPSHWRFGGIATPGTIAMVEDNLYLIDTRNTDFNVVSKRTIHEIAHQYWGHTLTPKSVDGGGLITEGLCKYTEAVIMEELYGKKVLWQLNEQANNRYFTDRAFAVQKEVPLYLENGQSHLVYGKNCVSFTAIKELIGTTQVNKAIKQLLEAHKNDIEPKVTSLDLLNELYAVTPVTYHSLIDDWFKRIITYELAITEYHVQKLPNGRFKITFTVNTKRFETQENGDIVEIPINEPVLIGAFTRHPSTATAKEIQYLKAHSFTASQQSIQITVDTLPTYIAIDPYGTRPDANRVNNIKLIE